MKKRNAGKVITLMLMALMALASVAQGSEVWEREFDVEPGQKIDLEMKYGGSLTVEGWDRDVVQIKCVDSENDLDDYEFEVKETRSGLRFRAKIEEKKAMTVGLRVVLMVPRSFDIETDSGGGGITITDVSGEFNGETGGGDIRLHNVSGDVDLESGGGVIDILDSELDGKVNTGGGGGVVRNVIGNLKATSGGGVVRYENVRDEDGDYRGPGRKATTAVTSGTIMYATGGGAIDLDEAPEGAIVETGGGRIDIRDASRFVDANTGGGDIHIEIKNGNVVAKTGAGDVEVHVEGDFGAGRDGIDLRTGHGDVTISVPADASMEFDVDLAYTRGSSRDFAITCDFEVDIEHTEKWQKVSGSSNKWKHIYGTATLNGGKHRVIIHGVNGNVHIEKR